MKTVRYIPLLITLLSIAAQSHALIDETLGFASDVAHGTVHAADVVTSPVTGGYYDDYYGDYYDNNDQDGRSYATPGQQRRAQRRQRRQDRRHARRHSHHTHNSEQGSYDDQANG